MARDQRPIRGTSERPAVGALCLLLLLTACGLDEVEVPPFTGPATFALSIRLTANPDLLVADNVSTSSIQAQLLDHNGQPVAGRDIYFFVATGGPLAPGNPIHLGTLNNDSVSATARTGANGIAQVIYRAPARPDATANQTVLIVARPIGDDFNGQRYHTVRIELRSAEPRQFPGRPGNILPVCGFIVQPGIGPYRTNTVISFQNTSFDPDGRIVRYEWDFGDGTKSEAPDNAKVYRLPSVGAGYVVILRVTDNDGAFTACTATIPVI